MRYNILVMLNEIAKDYFSYMAESFPVMCGSDEFYFFPRAEEAVNFFDHLDDLERDRIQQNIYDLKGLLRSLEAVREEALGLEERIDLDLLKRNILTFLREYGEIRIWQKDPSLYLKIALVGIDHLISRRLSEISENAHPWGGSENAHPRGGHLEGVILGRLKLLPQLFAQARTNLEKVPEPYREAALEMAVMAVEFFGRSVRGFIEEKFHSRSELVGANMKTLESLADFKDFLNSVSTTETFAQGGEVLDRVLEESYGYKKTLKEVRQIAETEYHKTSQELERLRRTIDPHKSWQRIISDYRLGVRDAASLLDLYRKEVQNLKSFLKDKDIISLPDGRKINVVQTPAYLSPLRSTASYSASLSEAAEDVATFYVTLSGGGEGVSSRRVAGKEEVALMDEIHNEYLFMTAHETYPGHHLLDTARKASTNPIRKQIESPLFYEGWASYAEELIDELGYVKDPRQRLVGLKRRLWRALRALLDLGLHTGKVSLEEAKARLAELGYHPRRAYLQARQYTLTYGYQLCYTVGKSEILRLRDRFASKIGLKGFHDFLLQGGEIPFEWIEKRLEKLIWSGS